MTGLCFKTKLLCCSLYFSNSPLKFSEEITDKRPTFIRRSLLICRFELVFLGALADRRSDEWCDKIRKKMKRPPKVERPPKKKHLLSCDFPIPIPLIECDPDCHIKKKPKRR